VVVDDVEKFIESVFQLLFFACFDQAAFSNFSEILGFAFRQRIVDLVNDLLPDLFEVVVEFLE
jgi:hypothetical protein